MCLSTDKKFKVHSNLRFQMKDKVLSLEGQLKISEDKCSQLQDQVDEVNTGLNVVQRVNSKILLNKANKKKVDLNVNRTTSKRACFTELLAPLVLFYFHNHTLLESKHFTSLFCG